MAERSEQNEPSQETSTTAQAGKGKSKLRLRILLVTLGIALGAAAYDFLVARPGVEQAYAKVQEANQALNTSGRTVLTSADVQELLARGPSDTYSEGPYVVEVYSWTAGLPVGINGAEARSPGFGLRSHDYYAVYRQGEKDLLFQTHFKFKVDPNALQGPVAVETGEGDDEGMMAMSGAGGGAPGGGPGGPGGAGPGGSGGPGGPGPGRAGPAGGSSGGEGFLGAGRGGPGGFDPMAMFDERDADGDGQLSGDEIPERMRERLDQIDTDGDGAISKAEMQARMSQFGGGGRGPGGPGGGASSGGRPRRPTLETDSEDPPK